MIMNKARNISDPDDFVHPLSIIISSPFVMTTNNDLVIGQPYLYSEDNYIVGVRIIDMWLVDSFIYLHLQELQSEKSFVASWDADYDGQYYLWSIADLPTLMNLTK
jgi:hypothetical protein